MTWSGMNRPDPVPWTPDDVIREYEKTGSEMKAARAYCITPAEVLRMREERGEGK